MEVLFEDRKVVIKPEGIYNKIYCEDCLSFTTQIPDNSIDLILTDPPYGINYKDNIRKSKYWSKTGKVKKQTEVVSEIKNDLKKDLDWDLLFNEFYRILKPKKMLYLFCRTDVIITWSKHILNSKFRYAHDFLWIKGDMGYGNLNIPGAVHEMVLGLSKGSAEKSRVLEINGALKKRVPACYLGKLSKKEYYGHPTQKPVALLSMFLLLRTDINDIVFDPFSGVASTALAAAVNHRRFIGCELDEAFYNQGNKRLADIKHINIYKNILPFIQKSYKIISGNDLS